MKKGGDKNNKYLMGVLGVLSLIIVGLIVGIVVINLNGENNVVDNKNNEEIVVTERDLLEGETIEEAKKRLAQNKEWEGIRVDIKSRVEKLLEGDNVDIDAISEVYDEGFRKANEWDRHDFVVDLINSRTIILSSKGLYREALDALFAVDSEMFDNIEKYHYYTSIIDLAKKLNNMDLVNEYLAKRNEIEADYLEQTEKTRIFVEAVGASAESYVGKDKNDY